MPDRAARTSSYQEIGPAARDRVRPEGVLPASGQGDHVDRIPGPVDPVREQASRGPAVLGGAASVPAAPAPGPAHASDRAVRAR